MASVIKPTLDFYEILTKNVKSNSIEVYPDYIIEEEFSDLMVRGGDFYAVWDQDKNIWNRNVRCIKRIIDNDTEKAFNIVKQENPEKAVTIRLLKNNSSGKWAEFKTYLKNVSDGFVRLDENVSFRGNNKNEIVNYKGVVVNKDSYVSKCLPYSLCKDDAEAPAWDTLMSTLFDPEEREKIEWAIGSIITGDSKRIQKFLVFYGKQGTGKSTVLNIIMKLFDGYYTTFKAENLVHGGDNFSLDFLADDPLLAIDADTNLKRIDTNALINQIVSHEQLKVNEKFKNRYPNKPICMLMLASNQPIQITDAKSGIIRRLIDVYPSNRKILPESRYDALVEQVNTELGAIASHCLKVYKTLGRSYYSDYIPERMLAKTNAVYNFMLEIIYPIMKRQQRAIEEGKSTEEGISAQAIWKNWKDYLQTSDIEYGKKRYELMDEVANYFKKFSKNPSKSDPDSSTKTRSWFSGFKFEMFDEKETSEEKRERKIKERKEVLKVTENWLVLDQTKSLLDDILANCPAQYAVVDEKTKNIRPKYKWINSTTKLKDIDTSKVHYVKVPEQLITIDFDLRSKDDNNAKDINACLEAAKGWPPTYAEISQGGGGLHLQYWYDGDVNNLSSFYDDNIEVKVFQSDSDKALRRRVSKCNNLSVTHISSGLPFKEKRKVINYDGIKDEQHLRNKILQAVKKECRPFGEEPKTITCMKYIKAILEDAQAVNMSYDIRDLDELIEAFASHSRNHQQECLDIYYSLDLLWPKAKTEPTGNIITEVHNDESPIIILDCEVIKNLTLVVYKELEPDGIAGVFKKDGPEKKCVRLYNPTISQMENLINNTRIVGHNVVKYDNYILYTKMMGWNSEEVAELSQELIRGDKKDNNDVYKRFRDAKNISYTDTLDVASEKKSLKKIEIEMHIPHKEMEIDWSKPLPESEWERLAQYCENDVLATEAYFLSKKWQADFKARKILAELTGMTVNDSTNNLVAQLIFGDVREPWHEFNYPDLKEEFPEYHYEFVNGNKEKIISYYGTGDDQVLVGEGGRVYAEPGIYYNTITFDVASMHPTSIIVENGFGPYTQHYKDLFEARIAIKHKDYDTARKLFGGRLAPYLTTDEDADDLAYALKIALNSTYGMTAAKFQNRFKDPRNIDNWVAKRGALFMEKLRREVQARKGHVIHIKTDSIKLVDPSKELQDFVLKFGKDYGYTFEVENKFERVCLINDAVYVALRSNDDPDWLKECGKAQKKAEKENVKYIPPTRWTATGARYQHPYVFKRIFSHEPLDFWDFCETKNVKSSVSIYLDLNEKLKDVSGEEKEKKKIETKIKKFNKILATGFDGKKEVSEFDKEKIRQELKDLPKDIKVLDELIKEGHNYVFVGKSGEFMPIKNGYGGGLLVKTNDSGSYDYVAGSKGYRWLESESLKNLDNWKEYIDIRYFRGLCDDALAEINKFGDAETFIQGEPKGYVLAEDQVPDNSDDPWMLPCGSDKYAYCSDCPEFSNDENKFGYCCKLGYNIENQILGESKEN